MQPKIQISVAPVEKVHRMKVPEELLPKISGDRTMVRAMSSLLWLKSIVRAGKIRYIKGNQRKGIKGYTTEFQEAAIQCRVSTETLYDRFTFLIQNKLLTYEHDHFKFPSYDSILESFSIVTSKFKYVKVKTDPYKVLQAMFFKYPQDQCLKAIRTMINCNAYLKDLLLTAIGSTRIRDIANAQIESFVKKNVHDPDVAYALGLLEADPYVGTEYYKKFMGLTGRGSIAYRKRDLERRGLIQVQHRRHDIAKGLYTTEKQRKSNLGYCAHIGGRLQLIMPDQITFNL